MNTDAAKQKSVELAYRAQEVLKDQLKLYLVYDERATEDYKDSGLIVGATTPEEAFSFWDGYVKAKVTVCELPVEKGVVTNLLCEQGRELTWLRQDHLKGVEFDYVPKTSSGLLS